MPKRITKICSKCGLRKPVEEFSRNKRVADGYSYWCKLCVNAGQGCASVRGKNHGERNTPLWRIWKGMRERCHNPKASNYRWYGARGIFVCPEWYDDYTIFRDWAYAHGYEPGMQLDRENNDKGYTPENCRWLTRLENLKNKRAYLPEELDERLREEAERRGVGVYALIREAIEALLDPSEGKEVNL